MEIDIPTLPLREYQDNVWTALDRGTKRVFIIWHRRSGKDHFSLNYILKRALQEKGVYYYIFPTYTQGKKIIWDDSEKVGMIPKEVTKSKNSTELKIDLINGSIIQIVGSDRYDSLRGTNPKGVIMSEYAYQHPMAWETIRPILAQNGGWAIFNTTPNGKNHAFDLWEHAESSDKWFVSRLTVTDTNVIDPDVLEEEQQTMSIEMFEQEYYCSFEVGAIGSFYTAEIRWLKENNRIGSYPYDPNLPVDTFWDIGIADSTAITFSQSIGGEIRIIDYYETNGKGFDAIISDVEAKKYRWGDHYMPHDFENKEYMIGESRKEYAKKRGFSCKIVKKASIAEGIDMTRRILKKCFFNKETTGQLIRCLENYHKEYDEKAKVYKKTPKHDWSSHGADSFRYLAMSANTEPENTKAKKIEQKRLKIRRMQEQMKAQGVY